MAEYAAARAAAYLIHGNEHKNMGRYIGVKDKIFIYNKIGNVKDNNIQFRVTE